MGVLFAGFLRVPMTSVFMVLEVSGNYEIIVPVIVANTFAYVVSRSLQPIPIFDLLTRQDGLVLPSLEEEREEAILRIEDAMLPPPPVILSAGDYIDAATRRASSKPDVRRAMNFYTSVFGFKAKSVMDTPQGVMHAELTLRDTATTLMLSPESRQQHNLSASTIGNTPLTLYILVSDVDAVFAKLKTIGGKKAEEE